MADIGEPKFSRTKRFDQSERLKRVQDAKQRTIGVDKDFFDKQVSEKADKAASQKKLDETYANMATYFDQKLVMLEQERREIKAQLNREMVGYRTDNQQKDTRREYDLSDPEYLKKSMPARVGDEDPRSTVSGMQKFDGEDLSAGERRKMQMAQQAAWVAQQTAEKVAKKAAEKAADDNFSALVDNQIDVQNQVADLSEAAKKELRYQTAATNKMLAAQKADKEAAEKEWEVQANAIDQGNVLCSPYMTEDPGLAMSMFGPHRVRPDHWKGMSEEQVSDILETRAAQRAEMVDRKTREKLEATAYAAEQDALHKALEIKASEVEQFKLDQRVAVSAFRKAQAAQKETRDQTLKATYTTNVPSDAFFSQFGTSAR